MKKFFGYLFLVFGMAFALSYFQNSSVNALDGSYDDAIMGQSSYIDQDENKIEEFTEKLEEKYEDCDIQMYKGDQPLYYFIMAVE